MVGALPTRTSVEIRTEGGTASIPAANARSAGVMTAAQAELLESLERWREQVISGGVVIPVPMSLPAPDLSRMALRDDVVQIAQRLARIEAAPKPTPLVPVAISPPSIGDQSEVEAIARAAAQAAIDACDEVQRIAARQTEMEGEIARLNSALSGLADIIDRGRRAA